jgi:hypothetical protein
MYDLQPPEPEVAKDEQQTQGSKRTGERICTQEKQQEEKWRGDGGRAEGAKRPRGIKTNTHSRIYTMGALNRSEKYLSHIRGQKPAKDCGPALEVNQVSTT